MAVVSKMEAKGTVTSIGDLASRLAERYCSLPEEYSGPRLAQENRLPRISDLLRVERPDATRDALLGESHEQRHVGQCWIAGR